LICEVRFLGAKWGRFGMEIGRMDWDWKTRLTRELHRIEHFHHPGNALISFVATLRLLRSSAIFCDVVLFYFCVFIMNGSWLNILDLFGINTAGVLICTSVPACWGILDLFITSGSPSHQLCNTGHANQLRLATGNQCKICCEPTAHGEPQGMSHIL
jgi:hypothetical protein